MSGGHFTGAFDNQLVARFQTAQHQPFIAVGIAGLHGTLLNVVVGIDNQRSGVAFGIAGDTLLREDRVVHDTFIDTRADKHSRQQDVLRVGEDGAQSHRACGFIDGDFGERQTPFFGIGTAILKG